MKLLVCFGTRPEYIKVKPILDKISFAKTLFTGQHTDLIHFTNPPHYTITINKSSSSNRINSICSSILYNDSIIKDYDYILVQGDTSTALAIALAAFHLGKTIIHLEAGLRTYDTSNPFPEETNRQLIAKIANIHLCPTINNAKNLISEGVNGSIFITGNTSLDNIKNVKKNIHTEKVILVTLHRSENIPVIDQWFTQLEHLANKFPDYKFIIPLHPNPEITKHSHILSKVSIIKPLTHKETIDIIVKCSLVISDSGGLQEECSFLNKKIIVCRKITERPESLGITSFLCAEPEQLLEVFLQHINSPINNSIQCPFGDGNSSSLISTIFNNLPNKLASHFMSLPKYNFLKNINNNLAFVITCKVTNSAQSYYLLESVRHVRLLYPLTTIYLIDDGSNISLRDSEQFEQYNIEVVDPIVKGGGEINPYLFSITSKCKHDTLVFVHDSCFIKKSIDSIISNTNTSFFPMWYSSKYTWDNVFDPINSPILESMKFYYDDLHNFITLNDLLLHIRKYYSKFTVTFGGMAIFHKSFVEYIKKYTNFFSIAHMFNSRINRCLFERILSCIYIWIYRNIYSTSICGDINNHPMPFNNTKIFIDDYHSIFLKIWQGR
jgi:UDP-N-acetylglucosamine 2-epimerase (non-hydrolysing)